MAREDVGKWEPMAQDIHESALNFELMIKDSKSPALTKKDKAQVIALCKEIQKLAFELASKVYFE